MLLELHVIPKGILIYVCFHCGYSESF